ncbi:hypothetical protein GIB67_040897 [Kingdonia uniflora]|uniref:Uncharacterized protein n=1 Tax=Kingdonia uniflora TaxID=39325 RepID=A0A7J7L7Y2_9MAGN|nr:hypothetical protein GIB67_040897 [Kingdonia uniflora]
MTKFNVLQKKRRAQTSIRKRQIHGDPVTGKLKQKPQTVPISGKRKRKLFKKWRRDQKEGLKSGLISMEDIEMAVAEGASQESSKITKKIQLKKGTKLKVKQIKRKGNKGGKTKKPAVDAEVEAMVE